MKLSATILAVALVAACSAQSASEDGAASADPEALSSVVISPLFADSFACSQHWQGQLAFPGDALGSDCFVTRLVETSSGGSFSRTYMGDGMKNEDWFSWQQPVLAGFDGDVIRVAENPVVNAPGDLGDPPASMIVLKRADGVHLLYAHIADPVVAAGDKVTAGQQIAVVGNNGYGRNPHIHLGAWMDGKALPIAFDLNAYGEMMSGKTDQ